MIYPKHPPAIHLGFLIKQDDLFWHLISHMDPIHTVILSKLATRMYSALKPEEKRRITAPSPEGNCYIFRHDLSAPAFPLPIY